MAEHSFNEGVCRYCGAQQTAGEDQRTCLSRAEQANQPRPVPKSVFAEVDPLYERIQELKREKDQQLAATTTIDL